MRWRRVPATSTFPTKGSPSTSTTLPPYDLRRPISRTSHAARNGPARQGGPPGPSEHDPHVHRAGPEGEGMSESSFMYNLEMSRQGLFHEEQPTNTNPMTDLSPEEQRRIEDLVKKHGAKGTYNTFRFS